MGLIGKLLHYRIETTLSIVASFLLLFSKVFELALYRILFSIFGPIAQLLIFIFFFLILIWSLIYAIKNRRRERKYKHPLFINLTTLALFLFFPFLEINFYINLKKRKEVVNLVRSTQDETGEVFFYGKTFQLPKKYRNLSVEFEGNITYKKNNQELQVFFPTFIGILDSYSAFVYNSENTEEAVRGYCTDVVALEKLIDYWYWVSCT